MRSGFAAVFDEVAGAAGMLAMPVITAPFGSAREKGLNFEVG